MWHDLARRQASLRAASRIQITSKFARIRFICQARLRRPTDSLVNELTGAWICGACSATSHNLCSPATRVSPMADWDPDLYHRFRGYRAEPVELIFARLALKRAERIVDLGCGTGEHTVELARRAPLATAFGIDSSAAMIVRAIALRDGLDDDLKARVNFTLADMRDFAADDEYDVVFSNAAFQWLGDHPALLAGCFRALRPGGLLAVQMPANDS